MKLNYLRILAFVLLVALSVGFGFAFDAIATAIDKHNYPIVDAYAAPIKEYAEEFAIPEAVLWAVVSVESDFVSNAVSGDGAIGLMQLTPDEFRMICTDLLDSAEVDVGMLYNPASNLRAGAAYLSELYRRYGVWETVFAAYHTSVEQVDAWLSDKALVSEQGRLQNLPDNNTTKYMKSTQKALEHYQTLYFR